MKQTKVVTLIAAAGLAALLAACGGGSNNSSTTNTGNKESSGTQVKQMNPMHVAHNEMSGKLLNINMGAMNGSKQDGSASVGDSGKNAVKVTINLANEPKAASEPAHIHKGTCKKLDPAPFKPLSNVIGGKSSTAIAGLTVADLKKGKYAINVHKSANDLKTYVSCGDLTL
jgi:hypothetical protein